MNRKKKILGASIGNCVHVAGIIHFLNIAEDEGYETLFLGPAVPIDKLFENICSWKPDIVAVSYRLTPENVRYLLEEIKEKKKQLDFEVEWEFGGTKPVADVAREFGFFSYISDGYDDINDTIRYLRKRYKKVDTEQYADNILDRINNSYPYPVLRHHFGQPSMEQTVEGIVQIAKAGILDVISLGPDQNAQQFFFHPENMNRAFDGAGGVPIRSREDLLALKEASLRGNYPLMRCYSGTEDVFLYAKLLKETINNAWAAIPLCWYNELDGRGTRRIEDSIAEAQKLILWHSKQGIPVEINEPHHWGMRDAHDVIPVVMSFLSAYNAKKMNVRTYIAQYMFNNPNGTSFSMDFAKVLAMLELTETLADDTFHIYRQTRAGLPLFHADPYVAKGQLAASTFMQMAINPHIIHVVGYCEADHAATADEVIESCGIVKGVIRHTMNDKFSIEKDARIKKRKQELMDEAKYLLDYIYNRYARVSEDPWGDPQVIADCVKSGIIDAVHIMKNEKFHGNLATKFWEGKCVAYDKKTGNILSEKERLELLENDGRKARVI